MPAFYGVAQARAAQQKEGDKPKAKDAGAPETALAGAKGACTQTQECEREQIRDSRDLMDYYATPAAQNAKRKEREENSTVMPAEIAESEAAYDDAVSKPAARQRIRVARETC